MHHLTERMHAGVGAAGTLGLDALVGDLRQSALERVLHAAAGGLRLPAAEGAAVVFHAEGDAHA